MLNLVKKFMSKKAKFYENQFNLLKQYSVSYTKDEKSLSVAVKAMVKAEKYLEKHLDELIKKYPGKTLGFSDDKIFVGENHSDLIGKLELANATIPFFAFEVPESQ